MFSKAGRLHDDMKKGQENDSLEHSLIAAANSECTMRGEGWSKARKEGVCGFLRSSETAS